MTQEDKSATIEGASRSMVAGSMLIKHFILKAIAEGQVTLAFRRWKRPSVKPGTHLRTEVGVLAIEAVEIIDEESITDTDARHAGFANRAVLLTSLRPDEEASLYRIRLSFVGADPRIQLRETDGLTDADTVEIEKRLARFDAASRIGPWTGRVLEGIATHPERAAGELASHLGLEKEWLKINIRKLKELGLTESLQPGYRLSPRGRSFLTRRKAK